MEEVKDIVFLTLTLGWKNEKRPSGPTELDLEAGNLVLHICFLILTYYYRIHLVFCQNLQFSGILSTQDYLLIGVLGHAF